MKKLGHWILVLVLSAGGPAGVLAQDAAAPSGELVWRLGTFDRASGEFQGHPSRGAAFVVGRSDPASDWAAVQPIGAGSARTIRFSLAAAPAAGYRLRLAFLLEHPGVPAVRLAINGAAGLFYLHPELDYTMGDEAGGGHAGYSHADLTVDFPGGYLHAGENRLTLTAVALTDEPVPDAGWVYDALELTTLPAAPAPDAVPARIEPTVFYRSGPEGLSERVDVIMRHGARAGAGELSLEIGGRTQQAPLEEKGGWGEDRVGIWVPEFSAPAAARLVVRRDGRQTETSATLQPARKWTVYVVPHIHLDVGYTDFQAKVAAVQARAIDEALDLIAKHPDFRYSMDGEWCLEQFMAMRGPPDRQRALTALQKGQIFFPAEYANLLTGFASGEALIRSLYPSANFSREHGLPFDYTTITDVPSYSASYPSILAAAGVKYLAAGANNDRAPILIRGRLHEASPLWWAGPDGGKVLLWYAFVYRQVQMLFGLPPLVAAGEQTLPIFLQSYERPDYRPHATLLYGTQGENRDLYPQQAELVQRWNARYAYPHLQYSGFSEALSEIARQAGDSIPTVRGDGGPYWEDGVASDAYYAAMERSTEARGLSAEKLATAASVINSRLSGEPGTLAEMWRNVAMADEHTFDSSDSVADPTSEHAKDVLAVKEAFAVRAHGAAEQVLRTSMAELADAIPTPIDSLVVFNALNWARDGVVHYDLHHGETIVDAATGQAVPIRVVETGNTYRRVEFLARAVPAVGYKVYELRRGGDQPAALSPDAATDGSVLENQYYRIELDPASGSVASLYDKELHRELVDRASPYRFGQYLYVSGGDTPLGNRLLRYGSVYPIPSLVVHGGEHGRIVAVERTPEGWRARLESSALNTPKISLEIQLPDREKEVEFTADLEKTATVQREAAYFAFPFALVRPRFRFEVQNGSIDPAHDMLPGAGREWFSVQHWVAAEDGAVSAAVLPLDAGLVTLGDINRAAWPTDFGERKATVFSYVMMNYWRSNYRAAQGGAFRFRYVVTSAAQTDPVALSRRGWEEMTPLEAEVIQNQDKSWPRPPGLDPHQGGFLSVDDPNLVLETWKPAEDGNGTIVRLLDLGGADRTAAIVTPWLNLASARLTNAVEQDGPDLPLSGPHRVEVPVRSHQIVTVRLVGASVLTPPTPQ